MIDQTYRSLEREWLAQAKAVPAFNDFTAFMEPEESSMVFGLSSLRLIWVTPRSSPTFNVKSLIYQNPARGFEFEETNTNDLIRDFKSRASKALEYVARNLTTLSNLLGPFNARN